jgi:hypothetical protein
MEVVPQNKRAMAFMWEQLHRFSRRSQETIRAHVPVTRRLEAIHVEQLLAQKHEWVLRERLRRRPKRAVAARVPGEARDARRFGRRRAFRAEIWTGRRHPT